MSLRWLFVFLVSSVHLNVFGQLVLKSPARRAENRTQFAQPFLSDSPLVLLRSSDPEMGQRLWLETYTDSLQNSQLYKLKSTGKEGTIRAVFFSGSYPVLFRSVYALGQGCNILYMDVYGHGSKPTMSREICRSPLKSYGDRGDFLITADTKEAVYLCYYTSIDENGSEIVNLTLTDTSGVIKYHKSLASLYTSSNTEPIQVECDAEGHAFVLYKEPSLLKGLSADQMMYKLAVFVPSQNSVYISILDSGKKDISDLYLALNKRHWVVSGFYNSSRRPGLEGFVYIYGKVDSGMVSDIHYIPFSEQFRKEATGESKMDRQFPLRDYTIHKVYLDEQGKSVMIAERIFTNQQNYVYPGTMQATYRTIYNYNEIVFFEVDQYSMQFRQKAIKKAQATVNDGGLYSGFVFGIFADRYLFQFNTTGKDGKMIKEYVYTSTNELLERDLKEAGEDVLLVPGSSIQLRDRSMLLFLNRNGNDEQLMRLFYPFW